MTEEDRAYHRAREQACRIAAASATTPEAAAIHNALAEQHRALADGKRRILHIVGDC